MMVLVGVAQLSVPPSGATRAGRRGGSGSGTSGGGGPLCTGRTPCFPGVGSAHPRSGARLYAGSVVLQEIEERKAFLADLESYGALKRDVQQQQRVEELQKLDAMIKSAGAAR
ncbi:hypothetical protein HaLaN_07363 [Haematococcus lacustris]|uniref:Uncharacterized protein n=1 Tax=Haematococcus lacustris TaxID=44745 RepID=A0A699YYG3_HAELA|nr:hypothetical protein HaLaN_07363 [Haematococcus lacustris]